MVPEIPALKLGNCWVAGRRILLFERRVISLLAIGIDIGGTKILGGLVDQAGHILDEEKVPSPAQDPQALADSVVSLVGKLSEISPSPVLGVGVAAAGFIDAERSTILYAPNLNWRHEPLRERLQARLNLPVVIENDANAAGWAEYKFGAGRGVRDMAMLTLGTGVGGAVISDSQLRRGGFGIGGELGHVRIVPDGRLCGCGQRGCVEQYASGTALLKAARKLVASEGLAGRRIREIAGTQELTGEHVYQALTEKDPGAVALFEQVGQHLGVAMATMTAVLDPQVYVIGGGLSAAGEVLMESIRRSFLANIPAKGYRPEARVVAAAFSNQAGVIGAADLVRDSLARI